MITGKVLLIAILVRTSIANITKTKAGRVVTGCVSIMVRVSA